MIEILLKNQKTIEVQRVEDIPTSDLEFHIMQFIDYSEKELNWLAEKYRIDSTIMQHFEDIEISSHFLENEHQASFHFSIPYYNEELKMVEEPIFIISSRAGLFLFSNHRMSHFFNGAYAQKMNKLVADAAPDKIFRFQFEFIADYFADITESLTKKIKYLANTILILKEFSPKEMDIITEYNFNNLLIKEALIETTRVFRLYLKSNWEQEMEIRESIQAEMNDLMVISDYIQFNFDRLDDLRENVSHKTELEQNYIFKMLTVATVCISLPTLIAGVYGMNFAHMPELQTAYGYPIVIVAMLCSAALPFFYFKRKKWL